MFVFNEGVPRAGKSYDAVKYHILPALKRKRHVWARLNGLDHARIAAYLKMQEQQVRDLLHHVDTKDVVSTFVCYRDEESGQWKIADHFKNSLIVIDEVHEFYVNERKPLAPEVENFFALLGQNGGDGVIMTQWLNRVHSAIKARIEKKNSFQKLSAVGMDGKYQVTYYQTIAAGKFQKIGGATKAYDPDIYPLYHGYAPGADNTEVYKEGGTNVWRSMLLRGSIFGAAGLLGIWGLLSFFTSGGEGMFAGDKAAAVSTPGDAVEVYDLDGRYVGVEGAQAAPVAPPDPYKDLTPEQRYVAQLAEKGRVRLAARAEINGRQLAHIEWVDSSGVTLENLSLVDLQQLGFVAQAMSYGFRLSAGEHVIVATAWPREVKVRETDARLYDTSSAGGGTAGLASVASDGGGAALPNGSMLIPTGSVLSDK